MSWQDDIMIEQEQADALNYMGEAEWRDLYRDDERYETRTMKLYCPHCKNWFLVNLHIDKGLGDVVCDYKSSLPDISSCKEERKEEECQGKKSTQQSS